MEREGGKLTHDTRDDDRNHAGNAKPGEAVQRAGHGAQKGWNRKDARIQHEAELVLRKSSESNLPGEELSTGCEDGKDDGSEAEELPAEGTEEDHTCVAHVVDYVLCE